MALFEYITENENAIRLAFFFGTLTIMGLWEIIAPKRALTVSKALRWANNLGLVFFNSLILRLIFPAAAVGVAAFAAEHGWGLLNYYSLPLALSIVLSIIIMDFVIYLQHVLIHAVPLLWRLHRVHHADLDYDVTTGARFHTLEIILSMLLKFATIVVLGPPVVAVIMFEVILNAMAMFNHGNVALPKKLDRTLRKVLVTPDMHRIHHSIEKQEFNTNFGFNLSLWDRLFSSYTQDPEAGQTEMTLGQKDHLTHEPVSLFFMLMLPFQKDDR